MISQNLSRALARQDLTGLYEIRDLVESLIDERKEAMEADHSPPHHPRREVLEEKKTSSITYRLEKVSCGKGCKGCPHGPYWYGYWKEGGKTRSKYIGKNLAVKA
jgi:hypothetical protein